MELGCSGGLNLRLDRFRIDLGDVVLGDPDGTVRLSPDVHGSVNGDLRLPTITDRVGIDPHPIDATTDDGRLTLLSFVWPDQAERFDRLAAAIDLARVVPAELIATADTAATLRAVLAADVASDSATIVQHSIVWQYIPTDVRWQVTGDHRGGGRAGHPGRAAGLGPVRAGRVEPGPGGGVVADLAGWRGPPGGPRGLPRPLADRHLRSDSVLSALLALDHRECYLWHSQHPSANRQWRKVAMSLQPLEDRIVVRPAEAEEKTASGLVIPDTAKEKPQQGEVLAVGPGRRSDTGELIPLDISVGDTVVYSKYGGTEITQEGEDLLILAGRDILAIVK